jgi:hypothetical protein
MNPWQVAAIGKDGGETRDQKATQNGRDAVTRGIEHRSSECQSGQKFQGLGAILTQAQSNAGALWCEAVARRPLAMQNFHLRWRNGGHTGPRPRPDQAKGCR